MTRQIRTLIHCDYGHCQKTAWADEATGWKRDGEKDYCPEHASG